MLALRRAWTGLRTRIGIEGVWAVAFLVMLFLGNATESAIWSSFLIWTIFVAVACMYWSPVEEPESWTLVDAPPRGREGTYAIR
jgi:hypothetical protein